MEELEKAIQEKIPDDATQNSQTAPKDAEGEPSTPAPEETPSPKVEQKNEPPFNEHPAWKSFQERKEREAQMERERADRLERQLMEITNRLTSNTQPDKDPYENMSAEEKVFYQNLDSRYKKMFQEELSQKERIFRQELQESRATQAAIIYDKFLKENPDVKAGSVEESKIADRLRMGYTLEDSCELVMGPMRRQRQAEESAVKERQLRSKKTQQKIAANQETNTIPPNSPINPKVKKTSAEIVDEYLAQQRQG